MSSHTLKSLQFTTFKIAKAIIFMNKDKYAMRGDKKEEAQRDFWSFGKLFLSSSSSQRD